MQSERQIRNLLAAYKERRDEAIEKHGDCLTSTLLNDRIFVLDWILETPLDLDDKRDSQLDHEREITCDKAPGTATQRHNKSTAPYVG